MYLRPPSPTLFPYTTLFRSDAGGEVIESQVTQGGQQVFTVAEVTDELAAPELDADELRAAEVSAPALVRLVGAELAEVKAVRHTAGNQVEWDIQAENDMDTSAD